MTIAQIELIEREIAVVEHLILGAITRKTQIALNKRLVRLEQELAACEEKMGCNAGLVFGEDADYAE